MDPFDEPVVVPIDDSIDLHHFHPSEILAVVDAYLDAAREAGLLEVRLIHGRGKGVQRANVRRFLDSDSRVLRHADAGAGRGGWGATLAWLLPLPEPAPAEATARLFVGDVQGCADELDALLARAERELPSDFELWCVGDLVNRGPESRRVLERVRPLHEAGRARVVLGNHEIGFMMKALGLRGRSSRDTLDDLLDASDRDGWIEWMRALPLVETGRLAGEPFAMVHAALHPGWSLAELSRQARRAEDRLRAGGLDALARFLGEDVDESAGNAGGPRDVLDRLTRCRSVLSDPDDGGDTWSELPPEEASASGRGVFVPWHAAWQAQTHGYGVVYGHWALQGLHVAPWLRGLDTGCVHHGLGGRDGFLTGWAPDQDCRFSQPDSKLWQVRARRAYTAV